MIPCRADLAGCVHCCGDVRSSKYHTKSWPCDRGTDSSASISYRSPESRQAGYYGDGFRDPKAKAIGNLFSTEAVDGAVKVVTHLGKQEACRLLC